MTDPQDEDQALVHDTPVCDTLPRVSDVRLTELEQYLIKTVSHRQKVNDWSFSELARRAGMDRVQVSRILRGKQRGSFDTWDKLVTATTTREALNT